MSVKSYVKRVGELRGCFRRCFLQADGKPTNDGEAVLAELRRFCYGIRPTIKTGPQGIDPYASIAAAARQEVFWRIIGMLNLDDSDLIRMQELAYAQDGGADG